MIRLSLIAASILALTSALAAADPISLKIGYLWRADRTETISLLDQPASNNGVAGAQLAIEDNNTTGKFLGQSFSLETTRLKDGDDPVTAVMQLADRGAPLENCFPARVVQSAYVGADTRVVVDLGGDTRLRIWEQNRIAARTTHAFYTPGQDVWVTLFPENALVLPEE